MTIEAPPKPDSKGPTLSADQLLKLFAALQGSTSVELKLVAPASTSQSAVRRLGFDPVEAEPRQVYFFDTPDLALNKAGIVVRARRSPGGKGDTVVKLRPVDPTTLDSKLRRAQDFKIEVDLMPGRFVCSASYKGVCTAQDVFDASDGKTPIESLFSPEQRAFYAAHAPGDIRMNALAPLGPIFLLRVKFIPKKFNHRVIVELWLYPDGSRIFELSTKAPPAQIIELTTAFKDFLVQCGISFDHPQESKTSGALKFFARNL